MLDPEFSSEYVKRGTDALQRDALTPDRSEHDTLGQADERNYGICLVRWERRHYRLAGDVGPCRRVADVSARPATEG